MDMDSLGAGLAALAFWGFLAAVVVGGMWYSIRERDAKHETMRRMIESGQPIDQELMEKLALVNSGEGKRLDRDFKVSALYILPIAAGVAVFGYILGLQYPAATAPLLGVAALLACLGIGFWIAAKIIARWYDNDDSSLNQL